MALHHMRVLTMRDYFERTFGLDPDDEGIEWFVDVPTPTTYSWVFLLKDKKVAQTIDLETGNITHKEVLGWT